MSIAVRMDWNYCPDGVELHNYGDGVGGTIATMHSRLWFRPRSQAVRRHRLEQRDLSNPIVLKFVGARDDEALVEFMSHYGLLLEGELPLGQVKDMREGLTRLLETRSPAREFNQLVELPSVKVVIQPKAGGRPTLGLQPKSLYGFMCVEAALCITGDSRVTSCENCGELFFIGPASGKRSGSIYCTPKCRHAAWISRKI